MSKIKVPQLTAPSSSPTRNALLQESVLNSPYSKDTAVSVGRHVVGEIQKNNSEKILVALEIYKGHPVLDVRVFAGGKTTRKGITAGISRWQELTPLLTAAIDYYSEQLADPESEYFKAAAQ